MKASQTRLPRLKRVAKPRSVQRREQQLRVAAEIIMQQLNEVAGSLTRPKDVDPLLNAGWQVVIKLMAKIQDRFAIDCARLGIADARRIASEIESMRATQPIAK